MSTGPKRRKTPRTFQWFIQALGKDIRRRREEKKLTIMAAAKKAKIHPSTWYAAEEASRVVKISTTVRIANVLGVRMEHLVPKIWS